MEKEGNSSTGDSGKITIGVTKEMAYNPNGDPYFLHSSDHPGMVLVSAPLTRSNFLTWSRSMRIALGAKMKLEFIDGKIQKLEEGT